MLTPENIKGPLRDCGYRPALLQSGFRFGENVTVPLVGFAQFPLDSRSACVAVLSAGADPSSAARSCRLLGAPLVFVCFQDTLQWWKQGSQSAEYLESIPADKIDQFFGSRQDEFSPDAIYRAKTLGRFKSEYQLSFVDLGLMPLVEEQVGTALGSLIERSVSDLKGRLRWDEVTDEQGKWLLKTIFWLVSGKILRDKQVPGFKDLDLNDVENVFRRLAAHYGTDSLPIGSTTYLAALSESARTINRFSSLALTTTESLGYVYENTLISKKTRSDLGTHSTPPFLVDYIVGNLAEWIKEIPLNERAVYEPACGHAAFLVSAMRLLTELLPADKKMPSRRGPYLRSRLHGADIDSFALELARLSLTLTDIPNPDGWDLKAEDMFLGARLANQSKRSTIVLANPPFDNFGPEEQQRYRDAESEARFINKSAEMLWRTVTQLPMGGVFGVVLPQTFLHSANATPARRFLVDECELAEVCAFPDKVFLFSGAESVVLMGRRKKPTGQSFLRYRRVRERDLELFRSRYLASTTRTISQSRFSQAESFSLRIPELEEVWTALSDSPRLHDIAELGQGLVYHAKHLPPGSVTYSETKFPGAHQGYVRFSEGLQLHGQPTLYWMNLDPSVIRRPGAGAIIEAPQVLLNYAPVSRGPWRLKALIDRVGHPVTGNFIPVRPRQSSYSLNLIWAFLNSPIANAFAFSYLSKRHNLVGDIRELPIPELTSFDSVDRAAQAYLKAVSTGVDAAVLQGLMLKVDIEVLTLYSLPTGLEQSLLALFTGWKRGGVPFSQTEYLPEELHDQISLRDFLEFEEDWPTTNRERTRLIDKKIAGQLTDQERIRLDALQAYADYHINEVAPRPTGMLDDLERRLLSGVLAKEEQT